MFNTVFGGLENNMMQIHETNMWHLTLQEISSSVLHQEYSWEPEYEQKKICL